MLKFWDQKHKPALNKLLKLKKVPVTYFRYPLKTLKNFDFLMFLRGSKGNNRKKWIVIMWKVFQQFKQNSLFLRWRVSCLGWNSLAPQLVKLKLTRLGLDLSHLIEHNINIKHYFQDTINPPFSCSLEAKSTSHIFLCCQNSIGIPKCPVNELIKTDSCFLTLASINPFMTEAVII